MQENIKKFGFGMMRLPKIGEEFDKEQIIKMIDLFLDNGYNYFDTSYMYEGSEEIIGELLVSRHARDKFILASKLPAWMGASNEAEAKEMFYTSLKRCKVEYFDYYMLHNIGAFRTKIFDEFNLWDFIFDLKKQGLIKKVGFSFHDNANVLDEVLTKYPEFEFVQLQINYADWENPQIQARACFEVAKKHGKPIVIMEPLKGGFLAKPPKAIKGEIDAVLPECSYAKLGFKFTKELDNIITILSGVSTLEQMVENLETFNSTEKLTENEKKAIENVQKTLKNSDVLPCTACKYCTEVCPKQIAIHDVFRADITYKEFEIIERAKGTYGFAKMTGGDPAECIKCGKCNGVCPQQIDVVKELERCVEAYSK